MKPILLLILAVCSFICGFAWETASNEATLKDHLETKAYYEKMAKAQPYEGEK